MTTINVTQEDIDHGKKGDCTTCPIALAAKRVFPGKFPIVTSSSLHLASDLDLCDGKKIMLPLAAVQFIQAFDHGRPVKPFQFEVTGE